MVTTVDYPSSPRYRVTLGDGYDGVVLINHNGRQGTGSLLYDGRAILTSAHLFDGPRGRVYVTFETAQGLKTLEASQVQLHPGYDGAGNNDLALVWLPTTAPVTATRYELYRESDEIGQTFALIGYGQVGLGSAGSRPNLLPYPVRLKAYNRFDADAATLKHHLGAAMSWEPTADTQLIADFDNGYAAHDALGLLIGQVNLGLGHYEGFIAPGDSGGPAFIQHKVAGIASYVASLAWGRSNPDIDLVTNSSFGEIAAWQRVSAYQQWIDQRLRSNYPDPPSSPQEVKREIYEGDHGTRYAYFLLQFTGIRKDPMQVLSVDYSTRDGTALAGNDYLPVSGKLNLYPGETQAVIAVEIIGDTTPEPNEYFYLDLTNPVGGSFGDGVLRLTAVRTIVDDDGWYA